MPIFAKRTGDNLLAQPKGLESRYAMLHQVSMGYWMSVEASNVDEKGVLKKNSKLTVNTEVSIPQGTDLLKNNFGIRQYLREVNNYLNGVEKSTAISQEAKKLLQENLIQALKKHGENKNFDNISLFELIKMYTAQWNPENLYSAWPEMNEFDLNIFATATNSNIYQLSEKNDTEKKVKNDVIDGAPPLCLTVLTESAETKKTKANVYLYQSENGEVSSLALVNTSSRVGKITLNEILTPEALDKVMQEDIAPHMSGELFDIYDFEKETWNDSALKALQKRVNARSSFISIEHYFKSSTDDNRLKKIDAMYDVYVATQLKKASYANLKTLATSSSKDVNKEIATCVFNFDTAKYQEALEKQSESKPLTPEEKTMLNAVAVSINALSSSDKKSAAQLEYVRNLMDSGLPEELQEALAAQDLLTNEQLTELCDLFVNPSKMFSQVALEHVYKAVPSLKTTLSYAHYAKLLSASFKPFVPAHATLKDAHIQPSTFVQTPEAHVTTKIREQSGRSMAVSGAEGAGVAAVTAAALVGMGQSIPGAMSAVSASVGAGSVVNMAIGGLLALTTGPVGWIIGSSILGGAAGYAMYQYLQRPSVWQSVVNQYGQRDLIASLKQALRPEFGENAAKLAAQMQLPIAQALENVTAICDALESQSVVDVKARFDLMIKNLDLSITTTSDINVREALESHKKALEAITQNLNNITEDHKTQYLALKTDLQEISENIQKALGNVPTDVTVLGMAEFSASSKAFTLKQPDVIKVEKIAYGQDFEQAIKTQKPEHKLVLSRTENVQVVERKDLDAYRAFKTDENTSAKKASSATAALKLVFSGADYDAKKAAQYVAKPKDAIIVLHKTFSSPQELPAKTIFNAVPTKGMQDIFVSNIKEFTTSYQNGTWENFTIQNKQVEHSVLVERDYEQGEISLDIFTKAEIGGEFNEFSKLAVEKSHSINLSTVQFQNSDSTQGNAQLRMIQKDPVMTQEVAGQIMSEMNHMIFMGLQKYNNTFPNGKNYSITITVQDKWLLRHAVAYAEILKSAYPGKFSDHSFKFSLKGASPMLLERARKEVGITSVSLEKKETTSWGILTKKTEKITNYKGIPPYVNFAGCDKNMQSILKELGWGEASKNAAGELEMNAGEGELAFCLRELQTQTANAFCRDYSAVNMMRKISDQTLTAKKDLDSSKLDALATSQREQETEAKVRSEMRVAKDGLNKAKISQQDLAKDLARVQKGLAEVKEKAESAVVGFESQNEKNAREFNAIVKNCEDVFGAINTVTDTMKKVGITSTEKEISINVSTKDLVQFHMAFKEQLKVFDAHIQNIDQLKENLDEIKETLENLDVEIQQKFNELNAECVITSETQLPTFQVLMEKLNHAEMLLSGAVPSVRFDKLREEIKVLKDSIQTTQENLVLADSKNSAERKKLLDTMQVEIARLLKDLNTKTTDLISKISRASDNINHFQKDCINNFKSAQGAKKKEFLAVLEEKLELQKSFEEPGKEGLYFNLHNHAISVSDSLDNKQKTLKDYENQLSFANDKLSASKLACNTAKKALQTAIENGKDEQDITDSYNQYNEQKREFEQWVLAKEVLEEDISVSFANDTQTVNSLSTNVHMFKNEIHKIAQCRTLAEELEGKESQLYKEYDALYTRVQGYLEKTQQALSEMQELISKYEVAVADFPNTQAPAAPETADTIVNEEIALLIGKVEQPFEEKPADFTTVDALNEAIKKAELMSNPEWNESDHNNLFNGEKTKIGNIQSSGSTNIEQLNRERDELYNIIIKLSLDLSEKTALSSDKKAIQLADCYKTYKALQDAHPQKEMLSAIAEFEKTFKIRLMVIAENHATSAKTAITTVKTSHDKMQRLLSEIQKLEPALSNVESKGLYPDFQAKIENFKSARTELKNKLGVRSPNTKEIQEIQAHIANVKSAYQAIVEMISNDSDPAKHSALQKTCVELQQKLKDFDDAYKITTAQNKDGKTLQVQAQEACDVAKEIVETVKTHDKNYDVTEVQKQLDDVNILLSTHTEEKVKETNDKVTKETREMVSDVLTTKTSETKAKEGATQSFNETKTVLLVQIETLKTEIQQARKAQKDTLEKIKADFNASQPTFNTVEKQQALLKRLGYPDLDAAIDEALNNMMSFSTPIDQLMNAVNKIELNTEQPNAIVQLDKLSVQYKHLAEGQKELDDIKAKTEKLNEEYNAAVASKSGPGHAAYSAVKGARNILNAAGAAASENMPTRTDVKAAAGAFLGGSGAAIVGAATLAAQTFSSNNVEPTQQQTPSVTIINYESDDEEAIPKSDDKPASAPTEPSTPVATEVGDQSEDVGLTIAVEGEEVEDTYESSDSESEVPIASQDASPPSVAQSLFRSPIKPSIDYKQKTEKMLQQWIGLDVHNNSWIYNLKEEYKTLLRVKNNPTDEVLWKYLMVRVSIFLHVEIYSNNNVSIGQSGVTLKSMYNAIKSLDSQGFRNLNKSPLDNKMTEKKDDISTDSNLRDLLDDELKDDIQSQNRESVSP